MSIEGTNKQDGREMRQNGVKKIRNRKVFIIHIISHFLIGITLVKYESVLWRTTTQIGPTPPLRWGF